MKIDPTIEELLNSYVDGEVTDSQRAEVQQLMLNDAEIAKRLRELQKCKILVGSLPSDEAPEGLLEEIKTALERRTLLGQSPEHIGECVGVRDLLVRKVLAAAAMIGLVAVLAGLVYTILAPQSGYDRQKGHGLIEDRGRDRLLAAADLPARRFTGRLELKTSDVIGVEAFISRTIEDNGLSDCISPARRRDRGVFSLSCSRGSVDWLLSDLADIWDRFDSAILFVETEQFGRPIIVDAVRAEQVARIVNQDSLEGRIKLAKDFAVLNAMNDLLPAKQVFAAIKGESEVLITRHEPVLTGPDKSIARSKIETEDRQEVDLAIVLVAGE